MKKLICCLFFVIILTSCTSIQKNIDINGLNKNKKSILKDFSPGSPLELQNYIKNFDLNKLTLIPDNVQPKKIEDLDSWHLKTERKITYEKWTFDSAFYNSPVPGDAVFYVYKQQEWEGSRVILWIPGFGVSDFAFTFLKKFFASEIGQGYNIVIYIPPYHMIRQGKGKAAGRGLLTSSPLNNIKKMTNSVKELRMVYSYLKNKKISTIGMWGGSMGGAFALLLQSLEEFDHISLMIPVLNWNSFITPESVLSRYMDAGFNEKLIQDAYSLISPVNYKLHIHPERVQVEAAEFDQLNPINKIKDYCNANKIKNISISPSGHATILLFKAVYRNYSKFISRLK